jgi:hypothetical protein
MGIRLACGAVLVCAMLAADAVSSADAAQKQVLRGRTAQKQRVKVRVDGTSVKMLHFRARLRCRNGDVLVVDESGFQSTPLRGRRFHDVQVGSTDEVFFRGRVSGGSVRGKLRVKDRLRKHGVRCTSRWIGFRANG